MRINNIRTKNNLEYHTAIAKWYSRRGDTVIDTSDVIVFVNETDFDKVI